MRAILIGATGLVGSEILKILLEDPRFSEARVFARRESGMSHPKLREKVVDFSRIADWAGEVQGDTFFSALGTTRKAAGSEAAQYQVDYAYQLEAARAARLGGAKVCVVVSSVGADAGSRFFYLRMKGELEREISKLGFDRCCLLQPGPLQGNRREFRLGERVSLAFLSKLPGLAALDRLRPVPSTQVARACVESALAPGRGVFTVSPGEILRGF